MPVFPTRALSTLFIIASFLVLNLKGGQFFLGGSQSHRLDNPTKLWGGKTVKKNFGFSVAMDKNGKFGVKNKKNKKSSIIINSEKEVSSNLNQTLRGKGFDLNQHPYLKSHFRRQMGDFQKNILSQVHQTRSVFIPELIRRVNKRNQEFLSQRKNMVEARISNVRNRMENENLFSDLRNSLKFGNSFKIVQSKPRHAIRKKDLKFYLKKNYLNSSKKESPKYKHLKFVPSLSILSKSKDLKDFW